MKQKTTVHNLKANRQKLFHSALKKTVVHKGDKRVRTATRVCGICQARLTTVSYKKVKQKDGTLKLVPKCTVSKDYYNLDYGDLLKISLCKDIRSCRSRLQERERVNNDYVNGK